jgi:hypothetical protein
VLVALAAFRGGAGGAVPLRGRVRPLAGASSASPVVALAGASSASPVFARAGASNASPVFALTGASSASPVVVVAEEVGNVGGGRRSLRVNPDEPELVAPLHVLDGRVDGAVEGGGSGGGPVGTAGRRSIAPVQVRHSGHRPEHAARLVSRIEFRGYPADSYVDLSNQ